MKSVLGRKICISINITSKQRKSYLEEVGRSWKKLEETWKNLIISTHIHIHIYIIIIIIIIIAFFFASVPASIPSPSNLGFWRKVGRSL